MGYSQHILNPVDRERLKEKCACISFNIMKYYTFMCDGTVDERKGATLSQLPNS